MPEDITVPMRATEEARNRVLQRCDERIEYYWKASRSNKNSYKFTRYSVIFLGAVVTLVSAISSASFIDKNWLPWFQIMTPVLAATSAIVSGISQAFQWGGAWSDMVITATRVQKQRHRIEVTPIDQLDPVKEMEILDNTILNETEGFFQRLFGSGGPGRTDRKPEDN